MHTARLTAGTAALLLTACLGGEPSGLADRAAATDASAQAAADPTADPGAARGKVAFAQDGAAAWSVEPFPELAAPSVKKVGAPSTYPDAQRLDGLVGAVPGLIDAIDDDALRQGRIPGWTAGRSELALDLVNEPEEAPATPRSEEAPLTATPTRDRLRMTMAMIDDEGREIRIEPVRPLGLAAQGAFAEWGAEDIGAFSAWLVGNVVVDGRTVDRDHLMYVSADPIGVADPADIDPDAPVMGAPVEEGAVRPYAVHFVVLPVRVSGTVPQLEALAAADVLGGTAAEAPEDEAPAEEEDVEAVVPQVIHVVLPNATRAGAAAAKPAG